MSKVKIFVHNEIEDYRMLLRNVPVVTMIFFCISAILMNLLANKELLNIEYLALDCGFVVSWMAFLCQDMLTKRFGAKASIKLSIFATGINLLMCVILFVMSKIGGNWGAYYDYAEGGDIANAALNSTFGGTWYVVVGSMTAFVVSSIVNSLINEAIGKMMKKNTFGTFAIRSYVSTSIGQFVDNMVFAFMVSRVFFGWTTTQCILCSLCGAGAELLAEIIFSPIGYKASNSWMKSGVGDNYLNYIKQEGNELNDGSIC